MGSHARNIIVEKHDWSRTASSTALLYQKAIERFEQQYHVGNRSQGNVWAASPAHSFSTCSVQPDNSGILCQEVVTW